MCVRPPGETVVFDVVDDDASELRATRLRDFDDAVEGDIASWKTDAPGELGVDSDIVAPKSSF